VLLAGLGATATAGPYDEPHLSVVPRSAAERAHMAEATDLSFDFSGPQPFEAMPGGAATADGRATQAASPARSSEAGLRMRMGAALFARAWVSAPSSTEASDGLGPLYSARACAQCHPGGGRGPAPEVGGAPPVSMVLRLAVPGGTDESMAAIADYLATSADPVYGHQLQGRGMPGVAPEYRLNLTYSEHEVALSGGETVRLRRPTYEIGALAYGPLATGARVSARLAPPLFGLGLIEAIPAADILAGADPEDADGDGISGRANVVRSAEYGQAMLGRFGFKAGVATIREQAARAFAEDIGLSTPLFPDSTGDCTAAQPACVAAAGATPREVEVGAEALDLVAFHSRSLTVPARRDASDAEVLHGKRVFHEAGCTACHRPSFVTHRLTDTPERSFQLIWPYSDLLLHDMGADLADGLPEARATGAEWRTAPLWGIGLAQTVEPRAGYLHDGRARSLLEAILWHGGEAASAPARVRQMPPADRAALIRFLESL